MSRVLVGVSGGIAAYKACELVRLLVKAGHEVVPLLTPGAEQFVTTMTFDALARRPGSADPYPHLTRADLYVIAPATANTLAAIAQGLSNNLVTEAALAHRGPLLVAPAMNVRMWEHPATQANAAALRERGVELIGPEVGELAEGEFGAGRMSEPKAIFARCRELLGYTDTLAGKRVVVSAGGTREPLDSARYVGNRSSGRMGVALAEEAQRRGAKVTLVAANIAVEAPAGVEVVDAPTAAELAGAVLARADADVVVMAAAVADYRPADPAAGKRSKDSEPWTVRLEPTVDVLRTLGEQRTNGQILVGFAADEGEAGLERARVKREAKGADLIVFNDVSRADIGFDAAENEVVLIDSAGERVVAKDSKERIAASVIDAVESLLAGH